MESSSSSAVKTVNAARKFGGTPDRRRLTRRAGGIPSAIAA